MYLFFDTETTGIPRNHKAPAADLQNWPRLVQLAWLLADEEANEISSVEYIVKPDGFTIPKNAAKIHGITTEKAVQNGVDLKSILIEITPSIKKASVLVAHNIQFDEKILGAEFLRAGHPNLVESKQRSAQCRGQHTTAACPVPAGTNGPPSRSSTWSYSTSPLKVLITRSLTPAPARGATSSSSG